MTDNYKSKYDLSQARVANVVEANNGSAGNIVEKAESGSQVVGTQNNYGSQEKQNQNSKSIHIRKIKPNLVFLQGTSWFLRKLRNHTFESLYFIKKGENSFIFLLRK